jgi:hypothetical protein
MQITIEYDSIWQNSFLSGDDGKPLSKENKREFVATSKSKDHVVKEIEKTTVLGVLCRLIGYQGKLHQIRESKEYYFRDIENLISFKVENEQITEETAFIVNKSDKRPSQSTFIGVLPDSTELFFSDSAPQLWSVLYLGFYEVMDFIWDGSMCNAKGSSMPRDILFRINEISNTKNESGKPIKTVEREIGEISEKITKEIETQEKQREKFEDIPAPTKGQKKAFDKSMGKLSENIKGFEDVIAEIQNSGNRGKLEDKLKTVVAILGNKYPDQSYLENGILYRIRLYAAALYLQAERMMLNNIYIDYCLNKKGELSIQGFSKRGFNGVRDFLNPLAGSKKKTVGTPFPLTKASGKLEINIAIDREKAKEIKRLIENAGVSSFYLGKKGLAYVTDIDTRELRN